MMDRRTFIISGSAAAVAGSIVGEFTAEAQQPAYQAELDFAAGTFTGTITEPDGTVNNLSGYHGVGVLPPLGGEPCPPSGSTADVVLSGVLDYPNGFTVPAGEVWEFDRTVSTTITTGGNIVVNGTLRSLPPVTGVTHRIRFVGINEANIVGGHAHMPVATDIGLWVDGGVLDISGTPKVSWNRTGSDPSWLATDELIMCPTDVGAYFAVPYTGGALPTATTRTLDYDNTSHTYTAEVANLTRDFIIESVDGMAHVMFINITEPQRLSFVELDRLGPADKLGRYPLHVHMNGEGSDGSVFRGNVARDCANHAFVPHSSHGCDFTGSIAFNTSQSAFWWDVADVTNRTVWNRCAAIGTVDGSGFLILNGIGNTCVDSFAFGTRANTSNAGILWPSQTNNKPSEWLTDGFVAHNNRASGVRTWNNDGNPRFILRVAAYRNGRAGFEHGAYVNSYRVENCVFFDNVEADMRVHATGPWAVRNCWIDHLWFAPHNVSSDDTSTFYMGRGWQIQRVTLDEARNGVTLAGKFRIESGYLKNDLLPSAFTVVSQTSPVDVLNVQAADFTLTP